MTHARNRNEHIVPRMVVDAVCDAMDGKASAPTVPIEQPGTAGSRPAARAASPNCPVQARSESAEIRAIDDLARSIRKDLVRMHRGSSGIGSALSAVDVVATLQSAVMRVAQPDDHQRDRFILSKGHAASALYSALAHKGFFPTSRLKEYLQDGSAFTGHPSHGSLPGIDASTGSLGHGLPMAVGMAMAARNDGQSWRTFVLLGDGECQEGSVWEGAMLASAMRLDQMVAIVDANGLQGYSSVDEISPIKSLASKWESFGWAVRQVNGHDTAEMLKVFRLLPLERGRPSAVIAHTVKGKGIREMEGKLEWHYLSVPDDRVEEFLSELDGVVPAPVATSRPAPAKVRSAES